MTLAERLTTGLAETLRALDDAQRDLAGLDCTDAAAWSDAVAWSDALCERAERYRFAIERRYGVKL